MAEVKTNIDSQLKIIKEASKGEEVREAIKEALRIIYADREYPPTTVVIKNNGTKTGGPWDKVIVDVPEGQSKLDVDSMASGMAITENGYYTLDDLKNLGLVKSKTCVGIDGLSVQVGQTAGELGEISITENGVYDPLLDGYNGYSKVYVNVLGGEVKDTYLVRFFDGKVLKEAKSVPRGTNAVYTGGPLSGSNFTGWNPSPVSVNRDMDCYAMYADGSNMVFIDKYTSTISDSWAQIIQKINSGTRPYPIGAVKNLTLIGHNGTTYNLSMMLMGYNLDKDVNGKYVSTWININNDIRNKSTDLDLFPVFSLVSSSRSSQYTPCNNSSIWWGNSLLRAVLNMDPSNIAYNTVPGSDDLTYYNNNIANGLNIATIIDTAAGTGLWNNIKTVTKYSFWLKTTSRDSVGNITVGPMRDQVTLDKLWLPSSRELCYPRYIGSTKSYDLSANMCTKGAADNGGDTQYGNPNTMSHACNQLSITSATYVTTRDNANYNSNTRLVAGNLFNSPVGGYVFSESGGSNYSTNSSGLYVPLCFCI